MSDTNELQKAAGYRDGWPKVPGWYDCLVEGEEMPLKFYVCQVARRPHWLDKSGNYMEKMYKIKWKPHEKS